MVEQHNIDFSFHPYEHRPLKSLEEGWIEYDPAPVLTEEDQKALQEWEDQRRKDAEEGLSHI